MKIDAVNPELKISQHTMLFLPLPSNKQVAGKLIYSKNYFQPDFLISEWFPWNPPEFRYFSISFLFHSGPTSNRHPSLLPFL